MTTKSCLSLLLLLALPSLAGAQPEVMSDLRALGKAARAEWPALAALVDDAERLARSDLLEEPDARKIYAKRYGYGGASAREARRDRRALQEAFDALSVLERATQRKGGMAFMYRGTHLQLVTLLNRSFQAQARKRDEPAAYAPHLVPTWDAGRSYRELFRDLPRTPTTLYGVTGPTLVLLVELAQDARRASAAIGPFDDATFPETMALAGEATLYDLRGRARSGATYGGWAMLQHIDAELVLTIQRDGQAPIRAALDRREDRWRASSKLTRSAGAAGRLRGDERETLRYQAEYRRLRDGTLAGRWRLRDEAGAQVERGTESLTRRRVAGAPADEVEPLLDQSDLFSKIVAACRPVAKNGTVPTDLLVTTANDVSPEVLLEGPAIFSETARLIAGARREVLYQALTFEVESEAGRHILGALRALEKRTAGPPVRVRFVINSHWAVDFGSEALQRAIASMNLDPRRVDAQVIAHKHLLLGGLHSKTLIVDGRRALVTGANPELVHDAGKPWFDAGFRVDGRAAEALRHEFNHLWHKVSGHWLAPIDDLAPPAASGRTPVLVATRKADGWLFSNSIDDPQGQAFVTAITQAKKRVRIHTPNLNDDAIRNAVVEAAGKNKVLVQLVLPIGFNEGGARLTGGTNAKTVRRLHDALRRQGGAQAVARLQIKWYAHARGGGRTEGNEAGASHTKYASFDGQVAIVGSGNLDTQAMNHSREVNLVIDGAELTRAWDAQHFEPSWNRGVPVGAGAADRPLGQ